MNSSESTGLIIRIISLPFFFNGALLTHPRPLWRILMDPGMERCFLFSHGSQASSSMKVEIHPHSTLFVITEEKIQRLPTPGVGNKPLLGYIKFPQLRNPSLNQPNDGKFEFWCLKPVWIQEAQRLCKEHSEVGVLLLKTQLSLSWYEVPKLSSCDGTKSGVDDRAQHPLDLPCASAFLNQMIVKRVYRFLTHKLYLDFP